MQITCLHPIESDGTVRSRNSGEPLLVSEILDRSAIFEWAGELGSDDLGMPWPVEHTDGSSVIFSLDTRVLGDHLVTTVDFKLDITEYARIVLQSS